MRRLLTALLLWSILATAAATGASAAPGQDGTEPTDLPAGFTDGLPVGGGDEPDPAATAEPSAAGASAGTRAASKTRYFGVGPWDAISEASAATPRCASLTPAMLTALVVSPIFKESSAATSPSSAPSPMTLSRYDEWNGTYATTSNQSSNYGLYAFRNPHTPYVQAYWHPGIGIWQYDSAGVGAPYTAIERMDVRIVAGDVAAGMASRYCNPPTSVVGHGAPFTDQERRSAAWWPWWAGNTSRTCPLCQVEYDNMMSTSFANVSKVGGISATGGAVKRVCTLGGEFHECWFVNPKVGVIEGATAWTASPDGRGSPTVAPAPLSKPFYVVKRGGREERHWLRADSGYGIDISGTRQLGRNERPRSNQAGSGVTWASSSGLCDLTTGRGDCGPTTPPPPPPPVRPADPVKPPAGVNSTVTSPINGTYRVIPLDVNGDGREDIFFHAPGAAGDSLWLGKGSGGFTNASVPNVLGSYSDVVALDVNGDGRDDLLFYDRSGAAANLWRGRADGGFTTSSHVSAPGRQPLVGDFDGNGTDDLIWYGRGSVTDAQWRWNGGGFTSTALTINGTYVPMIGDFDGNGRDDVFWYGPGAGGDLIWFHQAGARTEKTYVVHGTYQPSVGDFDGDGRDDVLWYGPGTVADSVWFLGPGGSTTSQALLVSDPYTPVVVDLLGDGRDDIVWNPPAASNGLWTTWTAGRVRSSPAFVTGSPHQAVAGRFSAGGRDGVLWYAPGTIADSVWWR